ncbi:MAG: hypothetical protein AAF557_04100 [Pseudomonadota bacterium]
MAVTTENLAPTAETSIFGALSNWIGNLMVWLGDMSSGAKAAKHAAELSKLTDDQLAARGLKREDIVEHAFGHLRMG